MIARLQWRRYRRTFRQPLHVSGHTWAAREGIILRLEREDDSVGFGEIAPVPWFPVESLAEAEAYLKMIGDSPSIGMQCTPSHLPCTAFAMSSVQQKNHVASSGGRLHAAALLPAGESAMDVLKAKCDEGYDTFKWKIGVYEPETEWALVKQMAQYLAGRGKLRLDANGGLTTEQLKGWTSVLKDLPIDYIEQPLPVGMESETAGLCRRAGLAYAFDESACTLDSLRRLSAQLSDAIYVVKPSQAGSMHELFQFFEAHPAIQRVFSWAFETPIGFASVSQFPKQLSSHGASGFGQQDVFVADVFSVLSQNAKIRELEAVWRQL